MAKSDADPESPQNRTMAPEKTVLSRPDVSQPEPDQTIVGSSDTVEAPIPQTSQGTSGTKDCASPAGIDRAEAGGSPATDKTFLGRSDETQHDGSPNSAEPAINDNLDSDKTFIPDGDNIVEQTVIGQLPPGNSPDLEDHFDTLIEDAQNPAQSPTDSGGMVIGDYQVLGELGRGGMGVVYKARHRKLNRIVALKMILSGAHSNNEILQRFISEARAVAHLQHPGIVQIFDIGEHDGLPFFSLEYVKGSDLKEVLAERPQEPRKAAALVEKLCHAMQYAHDNNILHRDIKPANILLDEDGEPKITDFGLAKKVDDEDSTGTQSGTIMGSPSYMPPEQARGELSSVTPRSDLYSLGAVLYQMLTGRPPFLAERAIDTVMQVVNNDPIPPKQMQPGIPVDIETICVKAMQKSPQSRYSGCSEMAEDLRRFLNNEPILARPVSRTERLLRWCKRNPTVAIPSGLAVSAVILTAIIATWAWRATAAQAVVIAKERDNVAEQRDEANKQKLIAQGEKKKAEEQRFIAVKAQKQAEENEELARKQALVALESIQFVITEVDDLLKDKPQLTDVRISLMEALSKKWDEIDLEMAGGVQGEAIATNMAVRQKIALAFTSLDKLEEADAEFKKLYDAGKQRVVVKGGSDSTRSNLAKICLTWAPVRKRLANDPSVAIKLLEEALALSKDISETPRPEEGSPSQSELRDLLAAIAQNLGVETLHSGDLQKASELFNEALNANSANLAAIRSADGFNEQDDNAKDSATAGRQLEHDRSAVALAYIQLRLGKTDESIALYKTAIAGRREIYERRPTMGMLKDALAGFLSSFGNAYLWLERPNDAEPLLVESVQLSKELHEQDPDKAAAARSYGLALFRLATVKAEQNKPDEAKALFEQSREVRTALMAGSDDRKNKISMMLVEARLGNAEAAQPLIDELGNTDKEDTEVHLDRARALAQLADKAEADDEKEKLRAAALTALERCIKDGYSDPFRISHENDLAPLREEERFKTIVTSLKTAAVPAN